MGHGKHNTIKAVCNKEMGYLAAARNITCLVLHYAITFAQIETLFKPRSQNWGVGQLFLQLLKRSLLNISYKLSGNISDALETIREH